MTRILKAEDIRRAWEAADKFRNGEDITILETNLLLNAMKQGIFGTEMAEEGRQLHEQFLFVLQSTTLPAWEVR